MNLVLNYRGTKTKSETIEKFCIFFAYIFVFSSLMNSQVSATSLYPIFRDTHTISVYVRVSNSDKSIEDFNASEYSKAINKFVYKELEKQIYVNLMPHREAGKIISGGIINVNITANICCFINGRRVISYSLSAKRVTKSPLQKYGVKTYYYNGIGIEGFSFDGSSNKDFKYIGRRLADYIKKEIISNVRIWRRALRMNEVTGEKN